MNASFFDKASEPSSSAPRSESDFSVVTEGSVFSDDSDGSSDAPTWFRATPDEPSDTLAWSGSTSEKSSDSSSSYSSSSSSSSSSSGRFGSKISKDDVLQFLIFSKNSSERGYATSTVPFFVSLKLIRSLRFPVSNRSSAHASSFFSASLCPTIRLTFIFRFAKGLKQNPV